MATIDDERFRAISDAEANRTDEELKRLIRLYDKWMADIEEEIEDQARRLSVDNSISYSKAKELLSPPELKKFRWSIEEYAKRAEESGSTGKWKSELNIESKKARVTRLEAAKFHIRAETERLYAEIDKTHETLAKDVYSEAYLKTGYFTQDELGSYSTFAKPDFERIKKTASKGWTSDGKNYSARVWENRQKVASVIETELTNAAIRGDSVDKMVKNLSGKIEQNVPKSYIERLVRTESTYMATAGQIDSYKELGADGVKFVATLDEVTCKTCGPLDGMVYLFDEAMPGKTVPPVHPNCRCTLAPWYDDNNGVSKEDWTRRARDPDNDKSIDVSEMNHDKWINDVLTPYYENNSGLNFEDWLNIYADPNRVYGPVMKDVDVSGFKVLKTVEEIEAFMEKNTTIEPPMNDVEKIHFFDYTADSSKINAYTRHIAGTLIGEYGLQKEEHSLREQSKSMDSLFERSNLLSNVVLFRAVTYDWTFHNINIKSVDGHSYFDGAYMSASPSLGSAIHVAKKRNADTILVMKINSGTGKGAYIDQISDKKGKELEFLIGRFEKYIVESVKQNVYIDGIQYNIIVVGDFE